MNKSFTIGWPGPVTSKKYGSIAYEEPLRKFLSEKFDLDFINAEGRHFNNKYLKALEFLFNLFKIKGKKDLWIRDFYSTVMMFPSKTKGKNLVVVHHLDFSGFNFAPRIVLSLCTRFFFYQNLKKADAIVVVSEFWKNHLLKREYKNVYKIYNSFNLSDFNIFDEEVLDFKKKHDLLGKPIIYLGNCQRAKGVVESFNALKDLNVHLVTSGERKVDLPTLNLNLAYRDYLKLLKASSIVIAMSKFEEGWCRTAHEAMLLKIPVIGSGLGGMRELLEGGNQIICEDFKNLKEKVEYLLKNPEERKKMGEQGYDYAKDFTNERFVGNWVEILPKVLS